MKKIIIILLVSFISSATNAQQLFEFKKKTDKKFDLKLPQVKIKSFDASKVEENLTQPIIPFSAFNSLRIIKLPLDGMPCIVPDTNYSNGILVYEPTQTMENTANHIPNAMETKTIKLKAIIK